MSYPAGWTRIHGDPGTATVASFGPSHRFLGYLNLTPRQGAETIANWAHFRPDHNADEGDRNVRTMAVTTARQFAGRTESCIQDAYTTATGARYIEIACIVRGRGGTVVIVGASPPQEWSRIAPMLQRAISSVSA